MTTSIRLAPEMEKRLDFLAKKTGRSKAFYLRELIEQGMEELEDYYLATEILKKVRSGKEKIYSAEEIRRDLELDD